MRSPASRTGVESRASDAKRVVRCRAAVAACSRSGPPVRRPPLGLGVSASRCRAPRGCPPLPPLRLAGRCVAGIRQFAELVASLVEILERQAAAIEKVKLKAIGRRNLVDAEPERRRRLEAELAALVSEKIAEQERLQAEYDSLARVLADQEEVMERLTSADA